MQFPIINLLKDFNSLLTPMFFSMQFNRGTSAMQHYVATRPMFIDEEVMNADTRLVLAMLPVDFLLCTEK